MSIANEIDVSSLSERFQMRFHSRASINISEEAEQPVASIISITTGAVVSVRVITTFKALVYLAGHSVWSLCPRSDLRPYRLSHPCHKVPPNFVSQKQEADYLRYKFFALVATKRRRQQAASG